MSNLLDGNEVSLTSEKETNQSIYLGMNQVFERTKQIISEMNDGERIVMKDLQLKVSSGLEGMTKGSIDNLVQLYCKQSKEVSVEMGAGGGVFKGGKKKRVDLRPRCQTCQQVLRAK